MAKKLKGQYTGRVVTLVTTRLANARAVDTRRSATLGKTCGKGGSSHIYAFDPAPPPERVAKIYKDEFRAARSIDLLAKLVTIVGRYDELAGRLPFVIWPDELIFDRENVPPNVMREALLGFSMRPLPLGSDSLHSILKLAKHRSKFGTDATMRLAIRLAEHFVRFHADGLVFCDLSPKNVYVSRDWTELTFIDADGYQAPLMGMAIPSLGVTEGYSSPNAISNHAAKRQALRTPDDDAFVLAILIFQLLVDRAHPFAAGPLCTIPGASELNANIVARRFVFANPSQYHPEGDSPATYARLATPLKAAFHRSFLASKPLSAAEWLQLLSGHVSSYLETQPTPEPTPGAIASSATPPTPFKTRAGSSLRRPRSIPLNGNTLAATSPNPTERPSQPTAAPQPAPAATKPARRRPPSRLLVLATGLSAPLWLAAAYFVATSATSVLFQGPFQTSAQLPPNSAEPAVNGAKSAAPAEVAQILADLPNSFAILDAVIDAKKAPRKPLQRAPSKNQTKSVSKLATQ